MTATPRLRSIAAEAAVVAVLFVVSMLAAQEAMRQFRAAGAQPFFYQSNFGTAVMMACGQGFVAAPETSAELTAFLNVARDDFDCSLLPADTAHRPLTGPANANWYYLYGASAGVWRVTGVSWTALDWLGSILCGALAALFYGLFRLVTTRSIAAAVAMLLTLSPANLTHLLSLRDFSKAPFVVAAVLILAVLVMRPLSRSWTLGLAAVYGLVVAIGYGFRGDLAVMVPFGAFAVLCFLPGPFRANVVRNLAATAALLAAFFVVAWPVISGLELGGCQYHFSLLGLTDPLTRELRLTPSLYRFGPHLTDTFADLKVGDYAARVLQAPVPGLCSADYDVASGELYMRLARTFPADFAVRAYASVLLILRVGLDIPTALMPMAPFPASEAMAGFYRVVNAVSSSIAPLGVPLTLAAVAGAWATSVRLGIALSVFVLFLTGYPAIRFDERHWFHLRFIPWWAGVLVVMQVWRMGARAWERPRLRRSAFAVVLLLGSLALALTALRAFQRRGVEDLIAGYLAAPTEPLQTQPGTGSGILVNWQPRDYAVPPAHRGSDLLVVTLNPTTCAGAGPLDLTVRYAADVPSRDLSSAVAVARPAGEPTRVFVPVFWQGAEAVTQLRFSGLEITGAPVDCIAGVARVAAGADLPLWVEMEVPADWRRYPLYESMRPPRLLSRWWGGKPS